MMNATRLAAEKSVLSRHLKENTYRFMDMDTDKPYLLIAAMTNSGHLYTLRICLEEFPYYVPAVFVMNELLTKKGKPMIEPDGRMHVLGTYKNHVQICHYGALSWTPDVSLYKVFIKCRLWLEMYEEHLKTGKYIDFYLKHQE